jgi:rhodanese-related sulfurtransferase
MLKRCLGTLLLVLLLAGGSQAHGTKDKTLISPAELADNLGMYHILDVRSVADFSKGHIPGSISIPLAEISDSRLKGLSLASEDNIALYGISESSAKKAKMLLDILGYPRIRILSGGYTHWVEDGQDSEKGAPQPALEASVTTSVPGLEVEPESYDLGIIRQADGVVETSFVVRNISDDTISVSDITTSCGCTTAEIKDKTFPPGQERKLTVFFDPNFHKEPEGKFSRTVFLQTSDGHEILAEIEVEIED